MEPLPMTDDREGAGRRGRWQLILVLVIFFGPIAAAVLLYANADRWLGGEPAGQHGQLFKPAKPLEALSLARLDGRPYGLGDLRGQWTAVVIGNGDCGSDCREALYKVRQAHRAQGKNIGRVQRLYVPLGGPPAPDTRNFLRREHPHMEVALPAPPAGDLEAFRHPEAGGLRGIYLVDPHANLVLRYGWATGAEGILKDLERLLKHSAIG